MTKTCPKCKTKNDENAKFCISCRQPFTDTGGRQGRLCPAGRHTMDPNWTHCPYCEAEAQAAAPRGQAFGDEERKMRNKTQYGDPGDDRRRTTRMDAPESPALREQPRQQTPADSPENTARIVAVLISYSRNPGGEIFPVREGKTFIGSGDTRSEAPADILFPDDRKMSSEHALIIYRHGNYFIHDQQSVNGTWVNGKDVPQLELPNYAQLRIGSTHFTFIKTETPSEKGFEEPEPARPPKPRGETNLR